jgi:hypothetical protein
VEEGMRVNNLFAFRQTHSSPAVLALEMPTSILLTYVSAKGSIVTDGQTETPEQAHRGSY